MTKNRTATLSLLLALVMLATSSLSALAAGGTGPDDALALPTGWQPLESGDELWYSFFYYGDGSEIQIRLEAVPLEGGDLPQGVNFQVWTPEEARRWRAGSEVEPIGRGSQDPSAPLVVGNVNGGRQFLYALLVAMLSDPSFGSLEGEDPSAQSSSVVYPHSVLEDVGESFGALVPRRERRTAGW